MFSWLFGKKKEAPKFKSCNYDYDVPFQFGGKGPYLLMQRICKKCEHADVFKIDRP